MIRRSCQKLSLPFAPRTIRDVCHPEHAKGSGVWHLVSSSGSIGDARSFGTEVSQDDKEGSEISKTDALPKLGGGYFGPGLKKP